jgi:gamma-glutamylcyclotransferase (GGCT)/AIG2-like uncharacterized protein YtfP
MADHLFLYGTLRPDLARGELAALVQPLRSLGQATMRGRLYDLGPYPAAVLDDAADSQLVGQVVALPDDPALLARLDAYEGFDPHRPAESLYLRVRREATLGDGRVLDCWVYAYNRHPGAAPQVPSGDYADWKRPSR